LLPLAGAVTRIAEGGDGYGAASVAGVTLRGAGFLGAPLIGPTALGEGAGLGVAGGGAFRAISPLKPLRSGLASGPFGLTRLAESAGRALRDCADRLSERDSSVFGAGAFTAGVVKVFAAGGVEVREVVSPGRLGSAGDVASTASIDFWASRWRFPSGPRPTVSPTVKLITANKITTAAT